MKKLFYIVFLLGGMLSVHSVSAQVNVSLNIGLQPQWGPVGYQTARYYYMPEIDVYYDISNRSYTYYDGRRWSSHRNLPRRYRNHDMYRTYKVVINDSRPWNNHRRYRDRYHGYARNYSQVSIRDGRSHHHYDKKHQKYHRKENKARAKHYKKMHKNNKHHGRHR